MRLGCLLALALAGCDPFPSASDLAARDDSGSTSDPGGTPRPPPGQAPDYLLFEAGPVRPVALTPSGTRLLLANTPDDRLEVFDVGADGSLTRISSIAVGLRPVAVAARTEDEVYVVNHLSDSVSVVDLAQGVVTRTLLVGDEPRDIVFAGPSRSTAFVTTAHRGQHRSDPSLAGVPGAGDPQLTTPGVGRADVWVFDGTALGDAVGGLPVEIVTLFGDTPRSLAVTPDGSTVYVGIFHSGNQTTVVPEGLVCDGFDLAGLCFGDGQTMPGGLSNGRMAGGNPGPDANLAGDPAPEVGLIVRYDRGSRTWTDELGRNWNNAVRFALPDLDVFALDATTLAVSRSFAGVGTTLFDLAVNPASGRVYVTNTEANNATRFEGPGGGGSTVQGALARSRVTILDPGTGKVFPRALNPHIDYRVSPAPPGTEQHSLATPTQIAFSADGSVAYIAAFGSSKVGVVPTAELDAGTFDPRVRSADYIPVSGGGPGGLVRHPTLDLLYVATSFDNGISTVDPVAGVEVAHQTVHTPESGSIVAGRPVLYDAVATSSNGEASCASCHIFGDLDHLAWDLGNPDDVVGFNPLTIELGLAAPPDINGTGGLRDFHPMKGAMLTQTLRGMQTGGAMHWRGDRADGFFGQDALDERLSFGNFIVAFRGLLGDDTPENDPRRLDEMDRFADFALELVLPPNPVRALDNTLTPDQQAGLDFYDGPRLADGIPGFGFTCEGCHTLDPAQGHFGGDGRASFENEPQIFKIPHLRNAYTRVGMFGMADTPFVDAGNNGFQGDQIRGFGFTHDGSVDTLFRFFHATVFADTGISGFPNDTVRRQVEQLVLAFDSDLAPVVGQQVTVRADNAAATRDRALLLLRRAAAPFTSALLGGTVTECDLVVQVPYGGRQVGMLYDPAADRLQPDRRGLPSLTPRALVSYALAAGAPVTFTCTPPGSGRRTALDRDQDGAWNGDEIAAGTDPADPYSY